MASVALHHLAEHVQDCIGHFEWSECAANCIKTGVYHITQIALGGAECAHSDGFVLEEACSDHAHCAHDPAPAGEAHGDSAHHVVNHLAVHLALPFFACVITALGIGEALHRIPYFRNLPESFVVVVVAAILGLGLRLASHPDSFQIDNFRPVSASTMNLVLLPIIIFTSGWSVPFKHLFNNFGYIVVFAVLGTIISTAAITAMIMWTGSLGWHRIVNMRPAVATAVLMSATDPVATLATFAKKKVEPTLNVLVFGESIVNDAVAVVLFGIVNMDEPDDYYSTNWHKSVLKTVAELLLGSMACGFLVACFMVLAYRCLDHWTHGHISPSFKMIYVISAGYFVNAVAESVEYSGIIACLFAGLTMSMYLRPLLGEQDYKRAGDHLQILAEFGDLTVFIMVGITTALLKSTLGVKFGCFLFIFCIIGRAMSVAPCALICNACRMALRQPILCNLKTSVMMWHAGLRGGIALTLVLQLNDWVNHQGDDEVKTVLVTATFLVISLLLVVMGGTTDKMLDALEIDTGVKEDDVKYDELNQTAAEIGPNDTFLWKVWKISHRGMHKALVGDAVLQNYIRHLEGDIQEHGHGDHEEKGEQAGNAVEGEVEAGKAEAAASA